MPAPSPAPPPEGGDPSRSTHAVAPGEAEPHARVRRFHLVVTRGPDAGLTLTSSGERVVAGTHESADLVLHDPTVSRFHCEITAAGPRVLVSDLGSRNGTLVDGVSIERAHLRAGSTLVLGHTELRFELRSDEVKVPLSRAERFVAMVGRSEAMRRVFALLERAAPTDSTVLLEGETGTGKEVAAESIHGASPRKDGPLIVVDCGAIPSDLLESELFGHEKGAFTGATSARSGAFEAANGGTLLLDEIGELGLELQPKLLRALEKREVKRVGSSRYTPVDVRLVAATNRSLRAEVNEKRFRSDLYYRLAVVEVRLPPLRERPEDIPLLVDHLLDSLRAADRPEAAALRAPEFLAELGRHAWPGNVRELRNYIERCLTLREQAPPLAASDSGAGPEDPLDTTQPLRAAREKWSRVFERRYIESILGREGGNVAAAARAAGVDRMYFYRLLWRHGLK